MPLRDIIEMLGTINTIKRQGEAQALAEQQTRMGAFGEFGKLLKGHVGSPEALVPLIHQFSKESGIPEESFRTLAATYQPPTADLNANVYGDFLKGSIGTEEGKTLRRESAFASGTGGSAGAAARSGAQTQAFGSMNDAMRRQFDSGTLSGMSAGKAALDTSLADLPIESLAAGARIGLGTQLSAAESQTGSIQKGDQVLRGTIAGSDANYRDRALAQDGALGMAKLGRSADGSDPAMSTAAASRLKENVHFLTSKPTTGASASIIIDLIEKDYNELYGPGAFTSAYGDKHVLRLNPGRLAQIGNQLTR